MKKNLKYYLGLKYEVVICPDDDGYVAYLPDLPGCITQVDHEEEIFPMLLDAKKAWLEEALAQKKAIPEPKTVDDFSGKFNLRVPKSVHKRLYEQAKKENVSLNHLVSCFIAAGLNK